MIDVQVEKIIPVLRIFNYQKAIEFYIDWLGFKINWEHTFDENAPVYMEIEREGLVLHLSEHHGDGTPGTNVFIWCNEVRSFHEEIINKKYKYNKPGLEETFYGSLACTVIDPFHNQISFNQKLEKSI
ncbi:glyoxalase superfamily protein [Arachidicoccus sp.]|uniref:glyoxalase superfamily protein n=1 Tax=Arachidicoccus sp. TaxID=1872624 RepID=UPI003D230AE1